MTYYRETQAAWLWLYALLLGVGFFSVVLPLWTGIRDGEALFSSLFMTAGIGIITLPLVLNLLCLRTEVQRERVYITLGLLFPMMWRRIPLDTIEAVQVVRYRPLRDAGGWGYRWGKYDGRWCWYYTMRGNRGVLVRTCDHRQHIIGSREPEVLARALQEALEKAP